MKENQKGFSEIILILVVAVLVGVIVFFVYQSKQTTEDTSRSQPVLNETPPYTLTEIEDGRVIFNSTISGYSIELPKDWRSQVTPKGQLTEIYNPALYSGGDNSPHGSIILEEYYVIPSSDETQLTSTGYVNETKLDCKENLPSNLKLDCWTKIPKQDKYLNIRQIIDQNSEVNQSVEDILSTFKFAE